MPPHLVAGFQVGMITEVIQGSETDSEVRRGKAIYSVLFA
jgi:hypothetical protein